MLRSRAHTIDQETCVRTEIVGSSPIAYLLDFFPIFAYTHFLVNHVRFASQFLLAFPNKN